MSKKKTAIRILPFFKDCPPKYEKLVVKDEYYHRYAEDPAKLSKFFKVVIDRDGWLVDGYANYLTMRDHNDNRYEIEVHNGLIIPEIKASDKNGEIVRVRVNMPAASRLSRGRRFIVRYEGSLRCFTAMEISVFPDKNSSGEPSRIFVLP